MINVDSWPLSAFQLWHGKDALNLSPEYQRRAVWGEKDAMLLVDSVARDVPIGAVTVYADTSTGYDRYEVIDGKQRLTALLSFLGDEFAVDTSLIAGEAVDDDEFDMDADSVALNVHGRRYSELSAQYQMALLQYKIPVFRVDGDRAMAIRAFSRMNRNSYALKPQEIRNAFYSESSFLHSVIESCDWLSGLDGLGGKASLLVELGAMTKKSFDRMQDLQFVSELVLLAIDGPQHRRDSLDHAYEAYKSPTTAVREVLDPANREVCRSLNLLWEILDHSSLKRLGYPASCENDVYALVGALLEIEESDDVLLASRREIAEALQGLRKSVNSYISQVRSSSDATLEGCDPLVREYAVSYLGGQINSRQRRESRIRVLRDVIMGAIGEYS